jgi:uncharacterized short protein YbdD (DUF466 family)
MYLLKTYTIVCPECDSEFPSYEKYIKHLFSDHEDQPSLRKRAFVRERKNNKGWNGLHKNSS